VRHEPAALRDFNLAFVRYGSIATEAVWAGCRSMSASPQKRTKFQAAATRLVVEAWTRSAEFRAAHRDAGQNKPLYIDHPQFGYWAECPLGSTEHAGMRE
jgi:hypothetical protein